MVSIATIGLYIAYALPIFFRVTLARKSFIPGPFNLGRYGILVGWVAVLWVITISVLFSLPVAYPITTETLNYTPVAVGGLLFLAVASWIISARHWFKGPITNIDTWSNVTVSFIVILRNIYNMGSFIWPALGLCAHTSTHEVLVNIFYVLCKYAVWSSIYRHGNRDEFQHQQQKANFFIKISSNPMQLLLDFFWM